MGLEDELKGKTKSGDSIRKIKNYHRKERMEFGDWEMEEKSEDSKFDFNCGK